MSIYGSVVFNESYNYGKPVITDTIESIMEDSSIVLKDENEDFVTEGMEAVATMTENYSNFMQRVGVSELNAIYATGDEMIYTENVVTDFLSGIKKFLMKIWEKIKSLFKRFIMVIDSYTKNDKAFINKYRQQIYRHKSLSDFTFKGYKYTIENSKITKTANHLGKITTDLIESDKAKQTDTNDITGQAAAYGDSGTFNQDTASKFNEKFDDMMEKVRGNILTDLDGKAGAYTQEEFRKEIDELLRNKENEKQDLDDKDIDVDEMVTELQSSRDTNKIYKDLFKTNKRLIDENIKTLERQQKSHIRDNMPSKNDDDVVTDERINKMSNEELVKYLNKDPAVTTKVTGIDDSGVDAVTKLDDSHTTIQAGAAKTYLKSKKADLSSYDRSTSKRTAAYVNFNLKVTRATKEMLITLDSCVLKALKERSRQYKACLVKIVYHNPKNESFTESYDYNNYNNYNFISTIQFK